MAQKSREEGLLSRDELYDTLQSLKGSELEYFLAELWESVGWETQVTSRNQDRGIDVIATQSSPLPLKILIQAKGYGSSSTVSSTEVQQYSSLQQQDDEADVVAVVTTGKFSDPARQLAESLEIKLTDIDSLVDTVVDESAYELLDPYVDVDLSTGRSGGETDEIFSEDPVAGPDDDLREHISGGKGLESLVPVEEYSTGEAVLLIHSTNREPRFSSESRTERLNVVDADESGTRPVFLHLTTEGIHLFIRANDGDRHEFVSYESVSSSRVEMPLFGSVKKLSIGVTDGIDVEYEYETMETEQQRRLRAVFEDKLGTDPLD